MIHEAITGNVCHPLAQWKLNSSLLGRCSLEFSNLISECGHRVRSGDCYMRHSLHSVFLVLLLKCPYQQLWRFLPLVLHNNLL
jgi:hypothetical protein